MEKPPFFSYSSFVGLKMRIFLLRTTKVSKHKNSPSNHLKLKSNLVLFWFQSLKSKRSVLFELFRKYSLVPSNPHTQSPKMVVKRLTATKLIFWI